MEDSFANSLRARVHPTSNLSSTIHKTFRDLEEDIKGRFYPSKIETPFPLKSVFFHESKFILISSTGMICYKKEDSSEVPEVFEIRVISEKENEIQHCAFSQSMRLFLGDVNGNLFVVDLQNQSAISIPDFKSFKKLKTSHHYDRLYILEQWRFKVMNTSDFSIKSYLISSKKCVTMEVREDSETYIIVADKDQTVIVYNLDREEVTKTFKIEEECASLKCSPSYLVCAHGSSIVMWVWGSWTEFRKFEGNSTKFTSVDISPKENYLVGAGRDGSLRIWILDKQKAAAIHLVGYSKAIENVNFIGNLSVFYHGSDQNKLFKFNIPLSAREYSTNLGRKEVKDIYYIESYGIIVLNIKDDGLYCYNPVDLKFIKNILRNKNVIISVVENQFLIATENIKAKKNVSCSKFELASLQLINSHIFTDTDEKSSVNTQCVVPRYNYLMLCYTAGIISIVTLDWKPVRDCKVHENEITAIASMHSGDCTISGDSGGFLIMYSFVNFIYKGKFRRHDSPVSALAISKNDQTLISGSTDGVIQISDISSKMVISTLKYHSEAINRIKIILDDKIFMVSADDSTFTIWSLKTSSIVGLKENFSVFETVFDDNYLCLAGTSSLSFIENPLKTEKIMAFGTGDEETAFFKYIYKIMKRKSPEYNPEYNNWIIAPYMVSVLHLYTLYNLSRHLKEALSDNAIFLENRSGVSPLTICIENRSLLMNDVTDYLIRNLSKNIGYAYFFENSLSEINNIGSEHLSDLYGNLYQVMLSKELPDSCPTTVKLPVFRMISSKYQFETSDFFSHNYVDMGKAVLFKQFPIKLCLEDGSQESVNFIESLRNCPNTDIFRTEFISDLLESKWKYSIFWAMFVQALVYFCYLILLILYISNDQHSVILGFLIFFATLLLLYEIFQIIAMKSLYLEDKLNLLDIIRTALFYLYVVFYFLGIFQTATDAMLIILTVVSFIRGISYFRIFDNTRYMIFLINQVLKDIFSFIILLCYSIVAVTTVYASVDYHSDRGNYFFYLELSYKMSLGDFEATDDFSDGEEFIFLFSSLINTIIMLNLLISILGDTFDKVQQSRVEADRKAIVEMILEVELLYNWKRKISHKKYFTACKSGSLIRKTDKKWEGKVKIILDSIEKTKRKLISENKKYLDRCTRMNEESNKRLLRDIRAIMKGDDMHQQNSFEINQEQEMALEDLL